MATSHGLTTTDVKGVNQQKRKEKSRGKGNSSPAEAAGLGLTWHGRRPPVARPTEPQTHHTGSEPEPLLEQAAILQRVCHPLAKKIKV